MKNNKIVKVLNQQICLVGCSDSSDWPYCSWAKDNGGCHGPWLNGDAYTYEYKDTVEYYCRGSCPEFCRKLLPPCIFREGHLDFTISLNEVIHVSMFYYMYLQLNLVNGVHGLKDLVIGHVEEVREKTLEPN